MSEIQSVKGKIKFIEGQIESLKGIEEEYKSAKAVVENFKILGFDVPDVDEIEELFELSDQPAKTTVLRMDRNGNLNSI